MYLIHYYKKLWLITNFTNYICGTERLKLHKNK